MDAQAETSEMAMLRCRYAVRHLMDSDVSLRGFLPMTCEVIFNPNTLQYLATLFETNIEKAFYS